MKVLIVDDAIMVHMVLERILSSAGHEVVGAVTTGKAALACIEDTHPNIVILDINLPEKTDGYSVLKSMKQQYPAVRVIIYSAVCVKEKIKYALELGADSYLNKPVKPEVLLKAIEQFDGALAKSSTAVASE